MPFNWESSTLESLLFIYYDHKCSSLAAAVNIAVIDRNQTESCKITN